MRRPGWKMGAACLRNSVPAHVTCTTEPYRRRRVFCRRHWESHRCENLPATILIICHNLSRLGKISIAGANRNADMEGAELKTYSGALVNGLLDVKATFESGQVIGYSGTVTAAMELYGTCVVLGDDCFFARLFVLLAQHRCAHTGSCACGRRSRWQQRRRIQTGRLAWIHGREAQNHAKTQRSARRLRGRLNDRPGIPGGVSTDLLLIRDLYPAERLSVASPVRLSIAITSRIYGLD